MRTAPTRINGITDREGMRDAQVPPRRFLRYILRGDVFGQAKVSSFYELTRLRPYPHMGDSRYSLNPTAVGVKASIWGFPRRSGLRLGVRLDYNQGFFKILVGADRYSPRESHVGFISLGYPAGRSGTFCF